MTHELGLDAGLLDGAGWGWIGSLSWPELRALVVAEAFGYPQNGQSVLRLDRPPYGGRDPAGDHDDQVPDGDGADRPPGSADERRGYPHGSGLKYGRIRRFLLRLAGIDPAAIASAYHDAIWEHVQTTGRRPRVRVYVGDVLLFEKDADR